jgi:peroxiredoxin Q/BCP
MLMPPALGSLAPEFALPDEHGKIVRLADFRGRRVVLYFYPKDDTPGCTTQACGFRDAHPTFAEHNATVIGISPNGPQDHAKFRAKYQLPFLLLCDEDHAVAEQYGVWGERSMYGVKYMGIIRSHFVIDEHGRLAEAQVKISPKESVAKAIQAIIG